MSENNFGGVANFTVPTHSKVSVGSTSTAVLGVNQKRKYAILQNVSAEPISINLGATAVVGSGMMLSADSTGGATPSGDGGIYEISPSFGNLSWGSINAISTSGSMNLLVTECE